MGEIVVSLKNVSKCFKRYSHPADRLKESLFPGKSRAQEFWALRDINLEITRGETLGIIGQNGSGKSTLLQIIAGTLNPTTGTAEVNGRVSALLELGSGFNPEFTGRQNVFFNARILGLSQIEIERKFDEIAAFADIGDFIDQPVKTYSSGMFVRLAFAVAINVDPEILIIDEALAVGDIFFQQKCFKFLDKIKSQGTSIIFVSHDTQSVLNLCSQAIFLKHGNIHYSGSPVNVVAKYVEMYYAQFADSEAESSFKKSTKNQKVGSENALETSVSAFMNASKQFIDDFPKSLRYGSLAGLIAGLRITDSQDKPKLTFEIGEEIVLSIKVNQHPPEICPLNVGFQIKDRLGQILIGTNACQLSETVDASLFGQPIIYRFKFDLAIAPGKYTVLIAIAEYSRDVQTIYDWIENTTAIDVIVKDDLRQNGLYFPEITVEMT